MSKRHMKNLRTVIAASREGKQKCPDWSPTEYWCMGQWDSSSEDESKNPVSLDRYDKLGVECMNITTLYLWNFFILFAKSECCIQIFQHVWTETCVYFENQLRYET